MWIEITLIVSLFLVCACLMAQNTRRLNSVLEDNLKLKSELEAAKEEVKALLSENEHLISALKDGGEKERTVETAGVMGSKPYPNLKNKRNYGNGRTNN